jgi:hypothetical protein
MAGLAEFVACAERAANARIAVAGATAAAATTLLLLLLLLLLLDCAALCLALWRVPAVLREDSRRACPDLPPDGDWYLCMAADLASLSSLFTHPTHAHTPVHTTPIAKHSQYFLRQALRLQLQPFRCPRFAASSLLRKASGFLARILRTVASLSCACESLFLQSRQEQVPAHPLCMAKQSQ